MAREAAASAWPAVTSEQHDWQPRSTYAEPAGSEAGFGPYTAAVLPAIGTIDDVILSSATRTLASSAATEIARFDHEVGAEIAPFTAILLRSEAAASSQIENLTASAKAIAVAEAGGATRPNAGLIVANTRAMRAALELSDHLDAAAILAMHDVLLQASRPDWAGRWRTEQVWIGGGAYSPHRADFVPPHHERVQSAIADLVVFMARNDIPPLIHAAIAHAQFETIHPFTDGNGRTGRALVHSLLRGKGLTRHVTVPISAGLLADTGAYFDALTSYRAGDPDPIVAMMAQAGYAAINNGHALVSGLRRVRADWAGIVVARRGSAPLRTLDLLLRQPVIDSPMLQRELGVSDTQALEAIRRLELSGVIARISGELRNRKYAASAVLAELDAFAERSGRRAGV